MGRRRRRRESVEHSKKVTVVSRCASTGCLFTRVSSSLQLIPVQALPHTCGDGSVFHQHALSYIIVSIMLTIQWKITSLSYVQPTPFHMHLRAIPSATAFEELNCTVPYDEQPPSSNKSLYPQWLPCLRASSEIALLIRSTPINAEKARSFGITDQTYKHNSSVSFKPKR